MPRLMLLRHAKSDHPAGVRDRDRPLDARGRRVAPVMGAYMAQGGLVPSAALVSPARRTLETWEGLAAAFPELRPELREAIYEAPPAAILEAVRGASRDAESLLVIGHNPGLAQLAAELVGTGEGAGDGAGDGSLRAALSLHFPTAALAVIDLDVPDWGDVGPGLGRLERFVTPKDLGA